MTTVAYLTGRTVRKAYPSMWGSTSHGKSGYNLNTK